MSVAELQALIRTDPSQRAEAWSEIRYRNAARQAFDNANGFTPGAKIEPWIAPDLSPPEPPGEGPLLPPG